MASATFETNVLSEALQAAVRGRPVRAAVFLTFRYDPGFFETEILPVLFDVSLSHAEEVRLLQLEDILRERQSAVTVYYDRVGLDANRRSSTLTQRIGLTATSGYFHPKNIFLLLDPDPDKKDDVPSLLVGAMSANLTRAGWWENVEVAHFEEIAEGASCTFRADLLRIIGRLRTFAPDETDHSTLEQIHKFAKNLEDDPTRKRGGTVQTRLYAGVESVPDFLDNVAARELRGCNLEVISPYLDRADSAAPLEQLIDRFRLDELRVLLPTNPDGSAACTDTIYDKLEELGVTWADLPGSIASLGNRVKRTIHAKVYHFFDPRSKAEFVFCGSVNLTTPAFHGAQNIESGFFLDLTSWRRPNWWLLDVVKQRPAEFYLEDDPIESETQPFTRLCIRFHWDDTNSAECYWDAKDSSPALQVFSQAGLLFELGPLAPKTWTALSADQTKALEQLLVSTTFLKVSTGDGEKAVILVEETGIERRPSIARSLTSDEILRYWALLSDSQKRAFLEEHIAPTDEDRAVVVKLRERFDHEADRSFFANFAAIFQSFSNLYRKVADALENDRPKEAVSFLFALRYDSLATLIEKILDEHAATSEADDDPVNSYVKLLCAKQVVDRIRTEHRDFASQHRKSIARLNEQLENLDSLRDRLTFGTPEERKQFFEWFEPRFLKVARPKEASA